MITILSGGLDNYYFNYLHKDRGVVYAVAATGSIIMFLWLLLRAITFRGKCKRQIENSNERFRRAQYRQRFTSISSLLVSWNPTMVDSPESGSHLRALPTKNLRGRIVIKAFSVKRRGRNVFWSTQKKIHWNRTRF